MKNWNTLQKPASVWLVEGLLLADGFSSIIGKPRAGKSTLIRNLVAAVIKNKPLLDRQINLPPNSGKVLYVHLDRKDQPWQVAEELQQLGITAQSEISRVNLLFATDLPATSYDERLDWLKKEVASFRPNLIIIDLMWQFVVAKSSNDYTATLDGINKLQDALAAIKYKGALVAVLHGRKATNPSEPFDDALGSIGQRGSFSTNIMLCYYRKESRYTIMSDQTRRDPQWGELAETTLTRNPDWTISLGVKVNDLVKAEKASRKEIDVQRLLSYLESNPDRETEEITTALSMSKSYLLELLGTVSELTIRSGKGIKGNPYRYAIKPMEKDAALDATKENEINEPID